MDGASVALCVVAVVLTTVVAWVLGWMAHAVSEQCERAEELEERITILESKCGLVDDMRAPPLP